MAPRTLTVFCQAGLANRLRVLVSGLTVAEASGRTFQMVWSRNNRCGAAFRELFANTWPVLDVTTLDPSLAAHFLDRRARHGPPKLLDDPRPDIVLGTNGWLVHPKGGGPAALRARCVRLLESLEPKPALRARIAEFRARHFGPTMIGLHLRRGDFLRCSPTAARNTLDALTRLDRLVASTPSAGILLCTDDGAVDPQEGGTKPEGLAELVQTRYGRRVVYTRPRSLDRRTVEAIQDALVDLWLLRATQTVVGTRGSSFSELAVLGRDVPYVMVGGVPPRYPRLRRLAWRAGVHKVVRSLFRRAYGYNRPLPPAREDASPRDALR